MTKFEKTIWTILAIAIGSAQPLIAQDASGRGGDDGREESDGNVDVSDYILAQNTPGTEGPELSDEELDLTCGAGGWLGTWLEDENGNPIPDSYEYWCLEEGQ